MTRGSSPLFPLQCTGAKCSTRFTFGLPDTHKVLQHHTPLNQPAVTAKLKDKLTNLEKHYTISETMVNFTLQHLITLKNSSLEQNFELMRIKMNPVIVLIFVHPVK